MWYYHVFKNYFPAFYFLFLTSGLAVKALASFAEASYSVFFFH